MMIISSSSIDVSSTMWIARLHPRSFSSDLLDYRALSGLMSSSTVPDTDLTTSKQCFATSLGTSLLRWRWASALRLALRLAFALGFALVGPTPHVVGIHQSNGRILGLVQLGTCFDEVCQDVVPWVSKNSKFTNFQNLRKSKNLG